MIGRSTFRRSFREKMGGENLCGTGQEAVHEL
jgi:hypothetical protein